MCASVWIIAWQCLFTNYVSIITFSRFQKILYSTLLHLLKIYLISSADDKVLHILPFKVVHRFVEEKDV